MLQRVALEVSNRAWMHEGMMSLALMMARALSASAIGFAASLSLCVYFKHQCPGL